MQPIDLGANRWSFMTLITGALALVLACLVVFVGPFAPQPDIGVALGELVGTAAKSAWAEFRGVTLPAEDTALVPQMMDVDDYLQMAVSGFAILALALGIIALARRESVQLAVGGVALGGLALMFQFVLWVAMIIAGVCVLIAIIANFGAILSAFAE